MPCSFRSVLLSHSDAQTMFCISKYWFLKCLLLVTLAITSQCSGDHDWEWAGGFDVHTDEQYTWVASKVNGAYADASMKILILSASSSSSDGIEGAESQAETLFEAGNATSVSAPVTNTTLTPGTLYQLVFDTNSPHSLFYISFSTSTTTRNDESAFVIFTEHVPTEFENGLHYLLDADGDDVEPVATEPASTTVYNNAGEAIGASCVVLLASVLGVFLTIPVIRRAVIEWDLFSYVNAFASGAILSLTVFLLIPESLLFLATRHPSENSRAAWFGSMVLGGFITIALIDWFIKLIFPDAHPHGCSTPPSDWESKGETSSGYPVVDLHESLQPGFVYPLPPTPASLPLSAYPASSAFVVPAPYAPAPYAPAPYAPAPYIPAPLVPAPEVIRGFFDCCPLNGIVWSVLIGDALCNFVDGVLIGFAFRYCGASTGWTVAAAAVIHELAAEISEFHLMIDPTKGGLSWLQALVLNILCSLWIIVAAAITSYVDIDNYAIGLMLAFASGVFFNVAIVPIWNTLLDRRITLPFIVICFLSFALGATALALVLLYHEHCEAGGSHAGHNH